MCPPRRQVIESASSEPSDSRSSSEFDYSPVPQPEPSSAGDSGPSEWEQSRDDFANSESESEYQHDFGGQRLPPRVVTPDHPLLELIGSSDDDTDTADGEIQSEDRARYSSFDKTVLSIFRKLTIDFRIPDITLTIGEIFSMCIGARYLSVNGSVKTIGATAFAFQRVGAVVERGCIPSRRKGHFVLPPFVNDRDELA